MRSTLVAMALGTAGGLVAFGASAQSVHLYAAAYGNLPESEVVDHSFFGGDWAAANYQTSAHVSAQGHPFDPPFTTTVANATFDQSHADGAVLRVDGLSRQPYRGQGQNENHTTVMFDMSYSLRIENLSGAALKIVLGNDLHGRFATSGGGEVLMQEVARYDGPSGPHLGLGSILLKQSGLTATELWTNTTTPTIMHDVNYGDINGYQMNSFEYLGQELVPGGTSIGVDVGFQLHFFSTVSAAATGGLAWFDFSNTGYLTTKAFDPVTGEDRSSEIRVTLVQTPAPGGAGIALIVGAGALRRRRRGLPTEC